MKKIECKLRNAKEPLQIVYPADYVGEKSGNSIDSEFFLSTTPKLLTAGEIALAKATIAKLPYAQTLDKTGCVMGMDSEIAAMVSSAEIDLYEQNNGLPSSAKAPGGGLRTLRERKILLTERTA